MVSIGIGLLGWGKSLLGPIRDYPWQAAFIALALWGAYERHQHVGWRDYAKRLENASAAATAAQKAMRDAETKAYQEKARVADANHLEGLDRARTDTARYIAAHRVRSNGSCAAQPQREADPSAEPQAVPSATVMVAEADVQRAAEWQSFGVACHDWALSISGDN